MAIDTIIARALGGGKLAKTQYIQSALSKQGMRKNLKAYGYRARELNPEITPKQITQNYDSEFGKGARTWQGEEQMFVSGGSTPTKQTDISLEGQRPLQLQDQSKNAARKRASEILPAASELWQLKCDDGLAEAALIAYWGATRSGETSH